MRFQIEHKNAICYSGYREGQKPGEKYPSYEEVKEDLLILEKNWSYLRIYDTTKHADLVLEVIKNEKLDLKVMLGSDLLGEISNVDCPWGGGIYSDEQLKKHKEGNLAQIKRSIVLANEYPDIVNAISVGNEATVEWASDIVKHETVIEYAKMVKEQTDKPVTFCENYDPWAQKLDDVAEVMDIISLHTYPLWEEKTIEEALEFTKENYYSVANKYPNKTVIITEAGWATNTNGKGISPERANQENQKEYYEQLMKWTNEEKILTYVFEAFDEPWKGSEDQMEPEKHWGLFTVDRKPKKVMQDL